MNCSYHPEIPATAYCQNCGKPLCKDCVRSVGGVIYCESCLLSRMGGVPVSPSDPAAPFSPLIPPSHAANPALAGLLGIIPGVGAMYNGQFVKGLAHVLIFAILVSLSHSAGIFGIFIAAWVVYQIFDAFHTAKARRDGLPLPDPFGLNDIGHRLGIQSSGVPPIVPPAGPAGYSAGPAAGYSSGFVPPAPPPYASAYGTPVGDPAYVPVPPPPSFDPVLAGRRSSDLPTGALLLIGLGVLFLLGTLGIFNGDWIGRGWPLIIIGVGVWLFVRRTRDLPPPSGGMPGNQPGSQPSGQPGGVR